MPVTLGAFCVASFIAAAQQTHSAAMMPIDRCLASMARLSLAHAARPFANSIPRFLAPALVQFRQASVVRIKKTKKKRTIPKDFKRHNLDKRDFPQFSLCEAMR